MIGDNEAARKLLFCASNLLHCAQINENFLQNTTTSNETCVYIIILNLAVTNSMGNALYKKKKKKNYSPDRCKPPLIQFQGQSYCK
jgi:hypothetical protein